MRALIKVTILGCDSEVFFLQGKGGSGVNELPHGLKLKFKSGTFDMHTEHQQFPPSERFCRNPSK